MFGIAQPTRDFFQANQGLIGNGSTCIKGDILRVFKPESLKIDMSVDEDTEC